MRADRGTRDSAGSPGGTPDPGTSTAAGVAAFEQTVYPLLTTYCAACHAGIGPGSPSIAHPDVAAAYDAVVFNQKVNLVSPSSSRLVRRLVADFHHCWSDCIADGMTMQAAIEAWAAAVTSSPGGTPPTQTGSIETPPLALAQGIDPHTGESFPADSPYQHPDTVRALFQAVQAMADPASAHSRPASGGASSAAPENAGKPWSDAEDNALAAAFDTGRPIPELAQSHRRTRAAIKARLVRLGKIEPSADMPRYRIDVAPAPAGA